MKDDVIKADPVKEHRIDQEVKEAYVSDQELTSGKDGGDGQAAHLPVEADAQDDQADADDTPVSDLVDDDSTSQRTLDDADAVLPTIVQ